jgi:thymidylate synthase
LECREIENQSLIVNPNYPFMTFKHRKYEVNYFKKEFRWKLTANKYDKSIQEHAKMWKSIINPDGTYNSNYGQFFFGPGHNIWDIVSELVRDPDSRKAYIPMLNVSHMAPHVIDTVCTLGVGFRIRDGKLNMSCYMRSSDIIFGLATDIPTFALLYRLVKGLLPIELGIGIIHIISMSSHLYSRHYEMVRNIIDHPYYESVQMPYCSSEEAMKIIASRGDQKTLKSSGKLGEWLTD